MITREEMLLEMIKVVASNASVYQSSKDVKYFVLDVYQIAHALTNAYFKSI